MIHRVQNDYLLDVEYNEEENKFKLMGDISDIVEMAYTVLCNKITAPNAKLDQHKVLGTRGTVIWTYKDNLARHLKYIFRKEREALTKISATFVRFSPNEANPLSVEIKCEQSAYDLVNAVMGGVDEDIMQCKSISVALESEVEKALADSFQKLTTDGRFYCRILFSGKEMTIFGKNGSLATLGVTEWDKFKRSEASRGECLIIGRYISETYAFVWYII